MKTKKKSGKTLRKSGKSQGKIREFDGIKKVGTLSEGSSDRDAFLVEGSSGREAFLEEILSTKKTPVDKSTKKFFFQLLLPLFCNITLKLI